MRRVSLVVLLLCSLFSAGAMVANAEPAPPKNCTEAKAEVKEQQTALDKVEAQLADAVKKLDAAKALPENVALQKIIDDQANSAAVRAKAKDDLAKALAPFQKVVDDLTGKRDDLKFDLATLIKMQDKLCADPVPARTPAPSGQVTQVPEGAVDTGGA